MIKLYKLLIDKYGENTILIPSKEDRLHCFEHPLNLDAKKLLFENDNQNIHDVNDEEMKFIK